MFYFSNLFAYNIYTLRVVVYSDINEQEKIRGFYFILGMNDIVAWKDKHFILEYLRCHW